MHVLERLADDFTNQLVGIIHHVDLFAFQIDELDFHIIGQVWPNRPVWTLKQEFLNFRRQVPSGSASSRVSNARATQLLCPNSKPNVIMPTGGKFFARLACLWLATRVRTYSKRSGNFITYVDDHIGFIQFFMVRYELNSQPFQYLSEVAVIRGIKLVAGGRAAHHRLRFGACLFCTAGEAGAKALLTRLLRSSRNRACKRRPSILLARLRWYNLLHRQPNDSPHDRCPTVYRWCACATPANGRNPFGMNSQLESNYAVRVLRSACPATKIRYNLVFLAGATLHDDSTLLV